MPLPLSPLCRGEQSVVQGEEVQSSPGLSRPKKPTQPSKLIDLGAAATFASQAGSQSQQQPVQTAGDGGRGGGGDPLADIFGDLQVTSGPSQTQAGPSSQGTVCPSGLSLPLASVF